MKKITLFVVFMLGVLKTYSQQDTQFTQYMYNTMVVNPAFVGSQGHSVLTAVGRTQWLGVKGAPNTQSLSFHTPLHNLNGVGFGINIMNDAIGPVNETFLDGSISYTIQTKNSSKLAFGLKLGGRFFKVDSNKFNPTDTNETEVQQNVSKVFATVGAGLYYYSDNYYLGVSVPNIIESEYYDQTSSNSIAKERFHLYTMAGYVFNISTDFKFKPSVLLKSTSGAPLSTDISMNFLINTKIHTGISYRIEDSLGFLAGFQVTDNMYLGYTYDLTTSTFRVAGKGSHELLLRYEFNNTPRRLKCSNSGLLWF